MSPHIGLAVLPLALMDNLPARTVEDVLKTLEAAAKKVCG